MATLRSENNCLWASRVPTADGLSDQCVLGANMTIVVQAIRAGIVTFIFYGSVGTRDSGATMDKTDTES